MERSPSTPTYSKDCRKLLPLFISVNWPSLVTWWVVVQKIYSKLHTVTCTNTHHEVTDLVNLGMVKNTKTWLSWERHITFLQNKKIVTLYFRWHILRDYNFVAKVTFKESLPKIFARVEGEELTVFLFKKDFIKWNIVLRAKFSNVNLGLF